jgi:hypothetical protein
MCGKDADDEGNKERKWKHSISGKILVRADEKYTMDGLGQAFMASNVADLALRIEVRKKTVRDFSEAVGRMEGDRSNAQAALEYLSSELLNDEALYCQRCNPSKPAGYPDLRKKAKEHFCDVRTGAVIFPSH